MSKRDMYDYVARKPLQDGDNLADTKKILNKNQVIFKYLLNNTIDHKQSNVDSDTDWNDLDNYSMYHFSSLQGPNSPELSKMGDSFGIVLCTSAPTGDRFQFAMTQGEVAFRTLHSEWLYIGQGIPANIDISKVIDEKRLGHILDNYYSKSDVDKNAQQLATVSGLSSMNSSNAVANENMANDIERNRKATNQLAYQENQLTVSTNSLAQENLVGFNQLAASTDINYKNMSSSATDLSVSAKDNNNELNNVSQSVDSLELNDTNLSNSASSASNELNYLNANNANVNNQINSLSRNNEENNNNLVGFNQLAASNAVNYQNMQSSLSSLASNATNANDTIAFNQLADSLAIANLNTKNEINTLADTFNSRLNQTDTEIDQLKTIISRLSDRDLIEFNQNATTNELYRK